jgi:nucleoside-diphosphate-sugar epimerase
MPRPSCRATSSTAACDTRRSSSQPGWVGLYPFTVDGTVRAPRNPPHDAHLVTGATGFVGAALVLALLRRTDAQLVCLVRPGATPVRERLFDALRTAAEAYEEAPDVIAAIERRCHAVAGDVSLPECGGAPLPAFRYSQIWHSAASLRFEDRYAEEIVAINTHGAANALAWARAAGVSQFNYMSTAYVSGMSTGHIREMPCGDAETNNLYERSKIDAEAIITGQREMGVRVFRPSIVVGHSRTRAATNFSGMYGFLRQLNAFRGMMKRTQARLLDETSIKVQLQVGAPVDLVPIDRVVENAVTIMSATDPAPGVADYYHLTNPLAPQVDRVVTLMFEELGLCAPRFVDQDDELEWLDERFNRRIGFYRSYMLGSRTFDRTNVEQCVGEEPEAAYAMTDDVLRDYYRWYLERLDESRQSLPVSR